MAGKPVLGEKNGELLPCGTLPAGMTFFGRPWSEATLIRLAFAYEQATKHRRPPASTPALR
jgi:Asp-tRNA(Asn)/Glu-tRNA(Gln) amidotransferase A subunit family amidase